MPGPRLKQITAAFTWGGLALLTYLLYLVIRPFLVPLGWACVLAVLVHPLHARLLVRFGRSRAAALTTLSTAIVVIVPAVVLAVSFAREMVDIAARLEDALSGAEYSGFERAWSALTSRVPALRGIDLAAVTADGLRRGATFLVSQAGSILTNIAVFFVNLVVALFTTFFILRDSDGIMRTIRHLLPMEPHQRELLIRRTGDLIAAGITSAAVVAGLQGLLGGLAWTVVGLPSPVFWGVVMGFACLLPFGAGVIYIPAALGLALTGSVGRGLLLAGLGLGVVSLADNIVRPMLLSERVHINGLVVFLGLLGGLSVFGLLGIVLGPIIIVTVLALLDTYVNATPEIGAPSTPDAGARKTG